MIFSFTQEEKDEIRKYVKFQIFGNLVLKLLEGGNDWIQNLPSQLHEKLSKLLEELKTRKTTQIISSLDISKPEQLILLRNYREYRWLSYPIDRSVVYESIRQGILGEYYTKDGESIYVINPTEEELKQVLGKVVVTIQPLEETLEREEILSNTAFARVENRIKESDILRVDLDKNIITITEECRLCGFREEVKMRLVYWRWGVNVIVSEITVHHPDGSYKIILDDSPDTSVFPPIQITAINDVDIFSEVVDDRIILPQELYHLDTFLRLMGFKRRVGEVFRGKLVYDLEILGITKITLGILPTSPPIIEEIHLSGGKEGIRELERYIEEKIMVPSPDPYLVILIADKLYGILRRRGLITDEDETVINELSTLKIPAVIVLESGKNYTDGIDVPYTVETGNGILDLISGYKSFYQMMKYIAPKGIRDRGDIVEIYKEYMMIKTWDPLILLSRIADVEDEGITLNVRRIGELEEKYKEYIRTEYNHSIIETSLIRVAYIKCNHTKGILGKTLALTGRPDKAIQLAKKGLICVEDLNANQLLFSRDEKRKIVQLISTIKDQVLLDSLDYRLKELLQKEP